MYSRIRQTRRQQEWREGQKGMDSNRSEAYIKGPGTTYLYPANTWEVGHGSRVSKSMVWRWRERGGLFEVLAQTSLGEMSYWDGISPKRSKNELGLLDACHRGR